MSIRIGVGREDFDWLRKNGSYYVDKTALIYELVHNTDNAVSLFTRPRRFGKTLNMSMIESFFDINRDSREVFDGLDITRYDDFCEAWMNQYPVLFISFKDVDGLDFESAFGQLKSVLADYCKKIEGVVSGPEINAADLQIFQRLMFNTAGLNDIKGSLKTIMRMMYVVYGKPVILLIDEYDVPLAKASEKDTAHNRYYEQMLDVIKGMLSISLKTNEYLKFAVITGCLRIAKESIFTGTNNFASYSVLDERFSSYFGFTQKEVDQLLAAAGLTDKADIFKAWYDGYVLWKTISYMDYHEDYYHAFIAGLFVGRGYETESNKERGLGRPDLLLLDADNRRAMIIETKKSTSAEQMEKDCDAALKQIADEEYAGNLDAGYEAVYCYGISFFRKTALIKKM